MDRDDIGLVMDEAHDYWIAQTGKSAEEFDGNEAVALYCNFSEDELNAIAVFAANWSERVLLQHIDHKMHETGNPNGSFEHHELIELIINATMPVTMVMATYRAGRKAPKKGEEYITTVFAEAKVENMLLEGEDLNTIWPQPVIEEVLARFAPEDAFRIGVLCGQHG